MKFLRVGDGGSAGGTLEALVSPDFRSQTPENPSGGNEGISVAFGAVASASSLLSSMVKDRGAWCAAVHGLQRVRHHLVTEQQEGLEEVLPS